MDEKDMGTDLAKVLIAEDRLQEKISELAAQIDADYDGHSLRILRKIAEYFDQELIVAFKPQRTLAAN